MRYAVTLTLAVGLAVSFGGCPAPEWPDPPAPPYNATGTFVGAWSGQSNEAQSQVVTECPLTLTLTQHVNAAYPGDHGVAGAAVVEYSCLDLPDWANTPPPSAVNVSGVLADNGDLTLLSGGCTTALCVVMALTGHGEDLDDDGFMDVYSGDWSYTILLAGVEPFGVTGTFEVAAETPAAP